MLLALFASSNGVHAASDQYWKTDGTTSSTWTSSVWGTSGSGPFATAWSSGNNAVFTADSTLTFATTTVGNVTVSAGKTVIVTAAGTLTLAGVRTFDIGTGGTLTWASQAQSTAIGNEGAGIIKNGGGILNLGAISSNARYDGGFTLNAGTIIVSGTSSFGTGVMTINGGTLQSSNGNTFTSSSVVIGGDFTFAGTASDVWNQSVNIGSSVRTITNTTTGGATRTFSGTISGAGGLTFAGVGGSGGSVVLGGANSYLGDTKVSLGKLTLTNALALQNSALDTSGAGVIALSGVTAPTFGGLKGSANFASVITSGYSGIVTGVTLNPGTGVTNSYAGIIANGATGMTLTKTGLGTQTLSGASTYSGATQVSGGTLAIDNNNSTVARLANTSGIMVNNGGTLSLAQSGGTASTDRLNDSATMTLNGGTFNTGGLSEHGTSNNTAGLGALTLSSSSVLDLGTGASVIAFADSHTASWSGTLSIYNWTGSLAGSGTDEVFLGSDTTGLTGTQLDEISFYSGAGTGALGTARILASGEIVPVPEPATIFGGLALLGLVGYRERKRISGSGRGNFMDSPRI